MKTIHLALALLGCFSPFLSAQQQGVLVGIVRAANGGWTLQGHTEPLKVGQLINKGDVPFIARSDHARLVIGLLSRAEPWEQNCTTPTPCEGPYALLAESQGDNFFAFLKSYWNDTSGSKRPAIFAGARDATPGPQHAVLVIGGNSIALGPALARFPAGAYKLKFSSIGSSTVAPVQMDVSWDGSSTTVPAVPPGFYALDAYSTDGEHVGSHAAILVIRSSDTMTEERWQQSLAGIRNAAGPDTQLADQMRLATVLALKDGVLR